MQSKMIGEGGASSRLGRDEVVFCSDEETMKPRLTTIAAEISERIISWSSSSLSAA
jgi:hypothetical protein